LLEKDFGAKDSGKASELAASGRVGVQYGAMWNAMYPLQQTKDNNPASDWLAHKIISSDDKPANPQIKLNVLRYYVVNSNYEHPEALIKLLNFWSQIYRRSTPEVYNSFLGADGPSQHYTNFYEWPAKKNLLAHKNVVAAVKSKDPSKLNSEEKGYYDNILSFKGGENKNAQFEKVFGETGSFTAMDDYDKNNLFALDQFYGAPTTTMKSRLDTIKKKEMEFYTKVIMGAESIDKYDAFVGGLNKLGLTEITKEVNEWDAAKK
jgi:putative aldouronate transport system substrate-binding protein